MLRFRTVRFLIVGGSANAAYALSTYVFLAAGVVPFLASAIAWTIAFAAAYLLQRGWTFSGQHRHGEAFPRYLIAQVACCIMVALAAQTAAWIWRPTHLAISIGSTIFSGALSYFVSLHWVFRAADERMPDPEPVEMD